MDAGNVKIAEDSDFVMLKALVDNDADWRLEYERRDDTGTKVWTKTTPNSNFKMVKIHTVFQTITPTTLFDVLHDPDYRKEWDEHMIESTEIGYLNPNNDVGYYSLSCPPPVKNRDFVLQRSWLDMGDEKLIFNHSVFHKDYPPKKGFIRKLHTNFIPSIGGIVIQFHTIKTGDKKRKSYCVMSGKIRTKYLRGTSYLTGFVIRPRNKGSFLGYVCQTDPKGKLPSWIVNKITQKFAPRVVKQLQKAAEGYEVWKSQQSNPYFKPWSYPEQTLYSPRISLSDCSAKYTASLTSLHIESDTE